MSSSESDESQIGEDVSHRLHATRTPFIIAVIIETSFCIMMTRWMWEDGGRTTLLKEIRRALGISGPEGAQSVVFVVWLVYGISVSGRLFCLCTSSKSIVARRSGRGLALGYMFFGTMNWFFYISSYYIGLDAATHVIRNHKVNIQVREEGSLFTKSEVFSPELNHCLAENHYNYAACGVKAESTCTLPFVADKAFLPGECVGHLMVGGTPCCISETVQESSARMTFFGHNLKVSIVFMLMKWMAILLVGWVLRFGFFAAGVGQGSFSKVAYLDILDIVIFSENMNEKSVRSPAYGFDQNGKPCEVSDVLYNLLYLTFVLAWLGVVISQMLYTACVPAHEEIPMAELKLEEGPSNSGTEKATRQLVQVQMPHHDDDLEEAATFLGFEAVMGLLRPAYARRSKDGFYRVDFTDGLEPHEMEVPLERLLPPAHGNLDEIEHDMEDMMKHKWHCSGFLNLGELGKGSRAERFERRASLLDAARSLFLLNLPFLLWRLYFDAFSVDILELTGRTMLIAKNSIWATFDIFKLLTCGNDNAAICGWQPMKAVSDAAEGKFGKVWVGPTGMTSWLAENLGALHKRNLAHGRELLESHRDWLLREKAMAHSQHDAYDERLLHVQRHLHTADEKMLFTFP